MGYLLIRVKIYIKGKTVSEIDVQKIATLARLKINSESEQQYQKQFEDIFKYFEAISAIDTEGVEPLVTPTDITQNLREDRKEDNYSGEDAVANAPEKSGNLFKVPPVV